MSTESKISEKAKVFLTFSIDAYTPETLPMARFAEYVDALSKLVGNSPNVHFSSLEEGSAQIVYWADDEAKSAVYERYDRLQAGNAEPALVSAFEKINDLLEQDQAAATLSYSDNVLPFPGAQRRQELAFAPVPEEMSVDGQLIRIGGRDKTIPGQLWDGHSHYNFNMTRGLAMDMCHFLFGSQIRVFGRAKWERNRKGEWRLLEFFAERFEELTDSTLLQSIQAMREIPGLGWREMEDPLAVAADLRGEE